jgi:SulP family sulfate permease
MDVFRMGGLVNFISHPVLAGFTSGAAILIIANQLPQLAGLKPPDCAIDMACYSHYVQTINTSSLFISITSLAILVFFGKPIAQLLKKIGITSTLSTAISKCGALLCVVLTTLAVSYFNLSEQHVAIVGSIPAGFPQLKLEFFNLNHYKLLLPYAAFIALIAYVESVAIAKVTANLRGEKINPNQELIALGTANLASALSGGMPVAGGFSRTMVNFSAGARSQMAMLIAAFILSVAVIFFSDDFSNIPKPALAAIIVVAIFRLVRIKHIIHTWHYDKGDGIAEIMTLLGVLVLGIEQGITLGIILTIASHLKKASHPHIAVVGRVPQTEHFRNIKRHSVETWHHLLLVRIDDSLTFANVSYIQDYLADELIRQPNTKHVVLIFTSVSDIDSTALEALEMINQGLQATNKTLNIAEAKGPVQDKLEKTDFIKQLKPGRLFFRTEDAVRYLG